MCIYIYAAYLACDERERFLGLKGPDEGAVPKRLADYLSAGDFDSAFEGLKSFTFSLAMLDRLCLFFVVGAPVALIFLALERDRVRWIQALVSKHLPAEQARSAVRCLELYLWSLGSMFAFIMLLVPFHLDKPWAHYATAACALTLGFSSICLYLVAPIDVDRLTVSGSSEFTLWASRQHSVVRPLLKCQAFLHVLLLASAVWKGENMGDDRAALLFGVLETLVIVGYQLVQGIFVCDDAIVGTKLPSPSVPVASEGESTMPSRHSLRGNRLGRRSLRSAVDHRSKSLGAALQHAPAVDRLMGA